MQSDVNTQIELTIHQVSAIMGTMIPTSDTQLTAVQTVGANMVKLKALVLDGLTSPHGAAIGVPKLAPHDLRRTFAKLAHKGSAALEQIQLSLGHASIQTTERYLGVRQDLADAPCDHLGLKITNG